MAYQAKEFKDTLVWTGELLDIWSGHDDDTGRFVCDVCYHNTDVGIMGVFETGFEHLKPVLTQNQLELVMEQYARAYALGYERAMLDDKNGGAD